MKMQTSYRFLIYITYPYAIPIGLPLQEEILKRGYTVRWFSELEETKSYFEHSDLILDRIEDAMAYDPHIILTATDTVPDFFKGLKVQIFHGFPANKRAFKKDHFRIRGFFDLYTTHGPSTTRVFKELAKKYKTFDVIETGWSKIDPLFYPDETTTEITREIPTVLISSTFTQRLSLAYDDAVFEDIERLSQSGKYNFICVLHPKLPQAIKDKYKSLNGQNFKYFDTTFLNPLFKQADIMFSDTTSAISEFVMLRKPVVTFRNNRPQPYFVNIEQIADIEPALAKALSNPAEIIAAIDEYIQETHPYTDGKSSCRVIDACIEFALRDKSYLKNKPWNIIRKWKLRQKLGYFTLKSYNKPCQIDETL
jgi:hypothetical protein